MFDVTIPMLLNQSCKFFLKTVMNEVEIFFYSLHKW